ncbi:MAG: ABC transporter permease, partial [Candidatus ainarchaeum sp.]|nr:ABC transporter permease [Candidatus ainarchaeum sp.]
MNLKDSFKLSVNSILHRRLRAWLTLLGIIIGVAAVVAIISIGEGAQASVQQRLSGLGGDIITVSAGFSRGGAFGGAFRGGEPGGEQQNTASSVSTPILTKRDILTLQQNPSIVAINGIVSGRSKLVFLSEQSNATVQGVDPNTWQIISSVSLASGRLLNSSDSTGVIIGNRIANT